VILAVVPAHNEDRTISETIRSLRTQTLPPDRIVVVADNCSDQTAALAAAAGTEVFVTEGNQHKKAGALNQALRQLLPGLGHDDAVLVMDADSALVPGFLARAQEVLAADDTVGAVGGIFVGDTGGGPVGHLQRNEYARYARDIDRKKGRAMVLSGTATLFRAHVLRQVAATRGAGLPGRHGDLYDTLALTEDNEMTLAIKTLGWRAVSPKECVVVTEVMTRWGDLFRQRLRWQRGAIENLRHYGLNRTTLPYFGQQVGMTIGLFVLWAYLLLTALLVVGGALTFNPFWAGVGLIFVAERVVTVWQRGPRARVVALTLIPEMLYDVFQQAVLVRAAFDIARRHDAAWHHAVAVEGGR